MTEAFEIDTALSDGLRQRLDVPWPPIDPPRGWHRSPARRKAFQAARRMTRRHAKSFYFASFRLPRAKRAAAYAVYAWCRHIDDRADVPSGKRQAPGEDALLRELDELLEERSHLPFGPAFHAAAEAYAIPKQLFRDLIRGCCLDRGSVRIANFAELEHYCYHVASVVGLMMSRIFGLEAPETRERAAQMGIALQLTNILRDAREDLLKLDRVYLPADEMERFGVGEETIRDGRVTPEWQAFMRFQIARARAYYAAGARGLSDLAGNGSRHTARLMSRIYAAILDVIEERGGDCLTERAYVSFGRKCAIAARAAL